MAGLPLKSGADFYNLEASRMRLHNLGADPTEFGLGQIYYNSSSGNNTSGRARLYTGNGFRSLAFMDDIDAINEKLDLLTGEVDLDGIIENMNEVIKFLEDNKDTENLMDLLNGKLSTRGGTIDSGSSQVPLMLSSTGATTRLAFLKGESLLGYLAFGGVDTPQYITSAGREYDLLHAGNIGSFKAGDSDKLAGQTLSWVQGNGLKIKRVKAVTSTNQADANVDLGGGGMLYSYSNTSYLANGPSDMGFGHIWQVGSYGNDVLDGQFAWDSNHGSQEDTTRKLWWRSRDTNGWAYAKWHQIAFTDSDIKGSVLNSDGDLLLTYNDGLLLGYGSAVKSKNTIIYGNSVVMRYGSNRTQGFILNSSGDVTISNNATIGGTVTIDGKTIFLYEDSTHAQRLTTTIANNIARIYSTGTSTSLYLGEYNGNAISIVSNNVGIGTPNPQYKLDVNGGIRTTDLAYFNAGIRLNNAKYISSYIKGDDGSTTTEAKSIMGINASNSLLIGYGLQTLGDTGIYGKEIYFAPNGEAVRVRISESGAVYINSAVASDDTEKLIVGGTMRISSAIVRQMATLKRTVMSGSSDSLIFGDDKGLTFFRGSEIAFQTQTGGARNMTMTWNDGDPRVGIGTSTPTEKLHVVGNLLVEGNIIATGEVSAGGAGAESGEGGTTGGGGDALIYSQEFTPSTTSVSIAHNLSSTKGVIVQVWEKDTIAGTWNMVLVDIEEVDSNNIKINFGRTETTLHKVVVMG